MGVLNTRPITAGITPARNGPRLFTILQPFVLMAEHADERAAVAECTRPEV